MRIYLKQLINIGVCIFCTIILCSCSGKKGVKVPGWVSADVFAETELIANRKKILGRWVLNQELSDQFDKVVANNEALGKKKRDSRLLDTDVHPSLNNSIKINYDNRLQATKAKELAIREEVNILQFQFDLSEPSKYLINGEAHSEDGNVNITLAEWEQCQFVIERNGPGGKVIEKWTPSPDGLQLHVSIFYDPPASPQTLIFNRMFDKVMAIE